MGRNCRKIKNSTNLKLIFIAHRSLLFYPALKQTANVLTSAEIPISAARIYRLFNECRIKIVNGTDINGQIHINKAGAFHIIFKKFVEFLIVKKSTMDCGANRNKIPLKSITIHGTACRRTRVQELSCPGLRVKSRTR